MKIGNDNGMGEGKQEQNKGGNQDNDVTRKKTRARIRALIKLKPEATARRGGNEGTTMVQQI